MAVVVAFKDRSTNSGLAAGELCPILYIMLSASRFLRGKTHALYSAPCIYCNIWECCNILYKTSLSRVYLDLPLKTTYGASASKNFALDTSPSFTVTIATVSPFDLSTPNIVIMTLKTSAPFPVSACAGSIVITEKNADVRINAEKRRVDTASLC